MKRECADGQRDNHDDGAVSEGKKQAAVGRQARIFAGVEPREPIDGGEVIRVETVLEPQNEDQQAQSVKILGQCFHGGIGGDGISRDDTEDLRIFHYLSYRCIRSRAIEASRNQDLGLMCSCRWV